MDIREYVTFWDEYSKSLEDTIDISYRPGNRLDSVFALSEELSKVTTRKSTKFDFGYMPEPYLGDILSGNISWLFLSLNPGKVFEKQKILTGEWHREIREKGYYEFAKTSIDRYGSLKLPGQKQPNMWHARIKNAKHWAKERGYVEPSSKNIGNLELVPFHSHQFESTSILDENNKKYSIDTFNFYWDIIISIVSQQKQKVNLIVSNTDWMNLLLRYYADQVHFAGDNGEDSLWDLIKTRNKQARDIITVSDQLSVHLWPRVHQMKYHGEEKRVPIEQIIKSEHLESYQRFTEVLKQDLKERL